MALGSTLSGLFQLTRPLEWSKTFGNMVIGYLTAIFFSVGFVGLGQINVPLFVLGFIALGPLLWGGLYALNDFTDRKRDARQKVKSLRPIPAGKVSPRAALVFSLALIVLALVIASMVNFFFLLCALAMLVNQFLYTLPFSHFKSRPVLDLVSGSLVNPFFRFYGGWVLVQQSFNAPLLLLFFVLGFQFMGFALYRAGTAELEKKLGYSSSVVVFGEKAVKGVAYLVGGLSGLSFLLLALNETFFPFLKEFGFLPLQFLVLAVLSVFLAPLYLGAVRNPKEMDLKRMHSIIYWHYLGFVFGFILLFVFF